MKFWQAITWAETDQLIDIARFAEEMGFHGLMSGDHAVYPESILPDYPYSENGLPPMQADDEYPDQTAIFAAMAAVTSKLLFTCGVYVLPLQLDVCGGSHLSKPVFPVESEYAVEFDQQPVTELKNNRS